MRRTRFTAIVAVACVAVVAAGCGGDDDNASSGSAPTKAPATAKKGGTLTMIASGDVDNKMDPEATDDMPYTYRLRAKRGDSYSPYSNEMTANPHEMP